MREGNVQVPCPCRVDSGAVRLCGKKEDQIEPWEGDFYLCEQYTSS